MAASRKRARRAKRAKRAKRALRPAPPVPHARNAELELAIEAEPDDSDSYLVYADWLQTQGDPRGELIALHHSCKWEAARRLFERHHHHFLGALADAPELLESRGGLGHSTGWRWGYFESIWIGDWFTREIGNVRGLAVMESIDEALATVLDHPSARFVRELAVSIETSEQAGYGRIANVLGARHLPTLRTLVLGDLYPECAVARSPVGRLAPMYGALPNLETLVVRAGSVTLGPIDLPRLRELVIITNGLDRASLRSICAARWPALERLSLQLGDRHRFAVKDLTAILDAAAFPKLKRLGLRNTLISDAICRALAHSNIIQQLEFLDLSLGTMTDVGAAALASGHFPRLGLDAGENYLTRHGLHALWKVAKLKAEGTRWDSSQTFRNRGVSQREPGDHPCIGAEE
jgi:uncharacterized protein (TIGR02996 family)